jgi:putative flippase GtrA
LTSLQEGHDKDISMSHSGPQTVDARSALARQIPAFLVIGGVGFCVDATITILLVQYGVSPLLARGPAFVVATLVNFNLNRAFTFRTSAAPWLTALTRYILVCLVGLAVNYAIYATCLELAPFLGIKTSPATLTLFVACGTAVATLLTFVGFRSYAFRG